MIILIDLYKVRLGIETRGSITLRNHLLDAIFAVLFNQAWTSSITNASLCPNHYPLHDIDVANLRSLTSSKRQTQIRRMPLPALLFQFVVSSFFYCFAISLSLSFSYPFSLHKLSPSMITSEDLLPPPLLLLLLLLSHACTLFRPPRTAESIRRHKQ